MEKYYLELCCSLFVIAVFYILSKNWANENGLIREAKFSKIFQEYDLSKRDPWIDQILFNLINRLPEKNIYSVSGQLETYFVKFSFNYLELRKTYKLIEEKISSKKKQLLLKNILAKALAKLSEDDLSSIYVSGLEKEYNQIYTPEFYREKINLIISCLERKNKKLFFEKSIKRIDDLTQSADNGVNGRLLLFAEKMKLCQYFEPLAQ